MRLVNRKHTRKVSRYQRGHQKHKPKKYLHCNGQTMVHKFEALFALFRKFYILSPNRKSAKNDRSHKYKKVFPYGRNVFKD